jgi:hypothetical protein
MIFGEGCMVWIGVFIEGFWDGRDLRRIILNLYWMLGAVGFEGESMVDKVDPCACIWMIPRRR